MTNGTGNNVVFPGNFFVQSLGLQGIPGSCPSAIASTSIDYGRATDCLPASITSVDAALAWFETNVACVLDPASILAAPDGYILVWDTTEMKLVPRTVGAALGSGLPGNSNNDVLLYNTLSMSYTPTSLLDWLTTNLPGQLTAAFEANYPCNTPGQILSCTATGWAATSFLQAFNTGLPGTNNFDIPFWNAGTNSWQITDAGSVIGNNLPAALAAAYPCTTGDLITCVGGQWQSTTFQAAMSSGLPGTTANDVLIWNGAQWLPQEEQVWLTQVLGPALGNQSITSLGDVPAALGTPGQVLTTNAAATGTIWTTPSTVIDTFLSLTDTPNTYTPGTILRANVTGTGLEPVDPCVAISSCSVTSLAGFPNVLGGPNQLLTMNALGTALEFVDFCNELNGCSITSLRDTPTAFGGVNQILVVNPAGTALDWQTLSFLALNDTPAAYTPNQFARVNAAGTGIEYVDLCTSLANCSITALSDVPNALGAANQVLAVDPTGTSLIWITNQAGTATFPNGAQGDILSYPAAGTAVTPGTLTDYLDTYYPPAGFCHATLVNDGSGWAVVEGITPVIQNWAFPLAPQSVGLELEIDPNTMCAEWVAPSHIEGTFQVPGDFPTVADFMTWATGRSVNVDLNVQAAQAGGIDFSGPNGNVRIAGNGQNMGEIRADDPQVTGSITNAIVDSVITSNNALLNLTGIQQVNNTNGIGIFVDNGARINFTGDLTIAQAGTAGLRVSDNGTMRITGQVNITAANTENGVLVSGNGSLRVQDAITVENSGGVGVQLQDESSLYFNSSLASNNNTGNGIEVRQSTLSGGFPANNAGAIQASNNGQNGIRIIGTGSLFGNPSTVETSGNGESGILIEDGSSASFKDIDAQFSSDNNTQHGVILRGGSQLDVIGAGNFQALNNGANGIACNVASVTEVRAGILIQGNAVGVSAGGGGLVAVQGGAVAGNATNFSIPTNALSFDGSFIGN